MKVICIHAVVCGPVRDGIALAEHMEDDKLCHEPGSEVDIPDEEVPRLLRLGAVRLPGSPDPNAGRKGPGAYELPRTRNTQEPGIYTLPKLREY